MCSCLCFSAAGGEIFDQCVSDEAFSEDDVKRLMRQILEGVSFLHQSDVVHLDLKVSRYPVRSGAGGISAGLHTEQLFPDANTPRLLTASEHPADQLLSSGRRQDR